MQDTKAFAPMYLVSRPGQIGTLLPSVTVAATAGGANPSTLLPGNAPNGSQQIQVANTSTTAWAYVNFGVLSAPVTPATVAAGYPVPPLSSKVVSTDPEVNAASVIMSAGSANVIFTRGDGA